MPNQRDAHCTFDAFSFFIFHGILKPTNPPEIIYVCIKYSIIIIYDFSFLLSTYWVSECLPLPCDEIRSTKNQTSSRISSTFLVFSIINCAIAEKYLFSNGFEYPNAHFEHIQFRSIGKHETSQSDIRHTAHISIFKIWLWTQNFY